MAEVSDSGTDKMDLVVRTLYKTLVMNNVDAKADVAELKALLHQRGIQEQIPIPVASKQRLVFKGSVLTTETLQQVGVRSGDHLVLLLHRAPNGLLDNRPVDTTPVPNAATIRSAILAEARRRGIENTIVDENPRANRMYGIPLDVMGAEVDNHLMQLIQALGGRAAGVGVQRRPAEAAGAGAAGHQAQAGAGAQAAGGAARRFQPPPAPVPHPGMMLFGMPPLPNHPAGTGAASAAPPPPLAIPEPDVQAAAQLGEMGFGEAVVRKALLLHRNEMEAALNWLLQHGDDPAAAEPLTDEQLRQIYSRGPRGPPSEPELVEQLVAMGFGRTQSAAALRRFRNMDMALAYLLRTAEEGGGQEGAATEGAAQQQQEQQQEQQRTGAAAPDVGSAGAQAGLQPGADEPSSSSQRPPGQSGHSGAEAGEAQAAGRGDGTAETEDATDAEPPHLAETEDREDEEMRDGRGGNGEAEAQDESEQGQGQVAMEVDREPDRDADENDEAAAGQEEEEGEDEEEEEDEDDDFTGDDDMPTMIEQLAMGQGAGNGRGTVLHVPLGGGGLGLAAGGVADDGFEAPFAIYGPNGPVAPAVAVTRGPDGNDLVLGSTGAAMPPLMPARGIMLGGLGGTGGGLVGILGPGGGGGSGAGPQLVDLGLLPGGEAGDDELMMQGVGLMQQLLSAVLQDALNGGEAGQGAQGGRRG